MIVSSNELLAAAHKATTGAGYPTGIAEEVSRATVWLCHQGLDGVTASLAGIEDANVTPPRLLPGQLIAFGDARAAMHGPSAIDLLVAGAAPDGIVMYDLDSPLLLVGLAGVAAASHSAGFTLTDEDGKRCVLSPVGFDGDAHLTPAKVHLRATTPQDFTPEGKRESAGRAGIEVDDRLWSRLSEYAARTYVPATEQSRIAGAGAGLTDND